MVSNVFRSDTPVENYLYKEVLRDFKTKKWEKFNAKWFGDASPLKLFMACVDDISYLSDSRFFQWFEKHLFLQYPQSRFSEFEYSLARKIGVDLDRHPLGKLAIPPIVENQQPAYFVGGLSFKNKRGCFKESTGIARVSVDMSTVLQMHPVLSQRVRFIAVVEKASIFLKVFTPGFCRDQKIVAFCGATDKVCVGLATLIRKIATVCALPVKVLADEDAYGLYLFGLMKSGDLMQALHNKKNLLEDVSWIDFGDRLKNHPVAPIRLSQSEIRLIRDFRDDMLYVNSDCKNIIRRILQFRTKIELEAMNVLGCNSVVDEYRKIVSLCWTRG